jgi:hypothetical protein
LGMGLIPYPWVGSWVTGVTDKGDGNGSSLDQPNQTRPIASLPQADLVESIFGVSTTIRAIS